MEPTGECPAPSTVSPAPSNHLAAAPPPPQPPAPVKVKTQPKVILSVRNDPIGLNVSDFLPVSPNLVNWTELMCGFGNNSSFRTLCVRNKPCKCSQDWRPLATVVCLLSTRVVLCQLAPSNRGGALGDAEALSQITKGHDTMCVMLSSRHKNLETVRTVWAREDIKVGSVFPAQQQQPMRAQLQRY